MRFVANWRAHNRRLREIRHTEQRAKEMEGETAWGFPPSALGEIDAAFSGEAGCTGSAVEPWSSAGEGRG